MALRPVASAPLENASVMETSRWPSRRSTCSSASTSAPGHPKGSCLDRGAADVFNALREEQGRRLLTNVKVVATGCMEACLTGPALLVAPDNVWYGGVTEADVPELVERHLVENRWKCCGSALRISRLEVPVPTGRGPILLIWRHDRDGYSQPREDARGADGRTGPFAHPRTAARLFV